MRDEESQSESDRRFDLSLSPDPGRDLTVVEVRILWSFIHGDIMDSSTRARLKQHWGFCSRHAWAYAVAEIELWQSGAGKRGGHQPFDVSILYTYLLKQMISEISRHGHKHAREQALRGTGSCLVCDEVRGHELTGIIVTHAGFTPEKLAAEANLFDFTRAWLAETTAVWAPHACPGCRTSASIPPQTEGTLCRAHQLETGELDDQSISAIVDHLTDLHHRMLALTDSMTQTGPASSEPIDASWVQTLGWFHGFASPYALLERT